MRTYAFLSLLVLQAVLAVPTPDNQVVFNDLDLCWDATVDTHSGVTTGVADTNHVIKWNEGGRDYIQQNGLVYELVSHPSFAEHQLRIAEPKLCDPAVKQYSGYLDVSDSKHLFFWFFESRVAPEEAPLLLWLNGGPGCSSSFGLLGELGPCTIGPEGRNVTHNPNSWNTHANIIFLDQPINVGFSYSDNENEQVDNSSDAGIDVYAFLELFLGRFPKYADAPFHVAAESYGGTYAPHIASVIHSANKAFVMAPIPGLIKIHLESVVLANGYTNPSIQMASIPDYACEGPYPVFDDPKGQDCTTLRSKVPTCQRLIEACDRTRSKFVCIPAALYCQTQLLGPFQKLGINLYDVRRQCDPENNGALCYKQEGWIETWMNDPEIKASLGVDASLTYKACSAKVNQAFNLAGDGMHNSALLLPELLEDGVRLLVYAGNADLMCNYMGNERWVEVLPSKFHSEFAAAPSNPWVTVKSGKTAGQVRSAGGGGFTAGNLTFVTVWEAGHMVPFDQPEAALDLITRWLSNVPLQ